MAWLGAGLVVVVEVCEVVVELCKVVVEKVVVEEVVVEERFGRFGERTAGLGDCMGISG